MRICKRILFVLAVIVISMTASAQNANYVSHTVSQGETLYSISKRYNTTVEEIVKFNPGSAEVLSIGQKLIIPRNTASKEKTGKTHTIMPGETLYRLSKMYDVTTDEICAANPGLSISNFKAGEEIIIPVKQQTQKIEDSQAKAIEPVKNVKEEESQTIIGTHKVKRKENIEKICEKYNITEEELIKANPILREEKLKRKMVLNIPAPSNSNKLIVNIDKNTQKDKEFEAVTETEVVTVPQIEEVIIKPRGFNDDQVVNVAVVLSFLLDSYAPKEQSRMVEYYQGFLMAVEQLKEEGYSFVINTYDAGQKESSLDSLLASGELDDVELIIGASYPKHNKELAKYAKEREIPLVIPFASKKDEAINNPYVYIANGIQQLILPQVSKQFVKTFPNANVLFVEDTESSKKEFIKSLTAELNKNGIPHTTLQIEEITNSKDIVQTLTNICQNDRETIIVPTSSSAATLNALLPSLLVAKECNFKLFGYPEWQIHAKDTREMMYEIDTYIYATFYSHNSLPKVAEFQEEYYRWYNNSIQNIYPRYGMLGYDTGYFFLFAASLHGNQMDEKINETPFMPVQSDFKFERISEKDGFVNNKFFFIHFSPEYLIEKIDFDVNHQEANNNEPMNSIQEPVIEDRTN